MLSAMERLRPASSWNWLANLTSAARLASSLTILSWSFSVIEGTPPVVDDKRGDLRLSHFQPPSSRFFVAFSAPHPGAWKTRHLAGPRVANALGRRPLSAGRRDARELRAAGVGARFGAPAQGLLHMDCMRIARPMSPLIFSFPLMKAAVGSIWPVKILTKSRESATRVRLGLSTSPWPDVAWPSAILMKRLPAWSPVRSNWMAALVLPAFSGRK